MRLLKSPSQTHLCAVRCRFLLSSSHPSCPGVSEQRKYCTSPRALQGELGTERRRMPMDRQAAPKGGSQPLPLLRGSPGMPSPSPAVAGFGPSTLPTGTSWQASLSSSFHFSSFVSIVLLFEELEPMIECETQLALASDATGWVFFFLSDGAHHLLDSSRGPQLS